MDSLITAAARALTAGDPLGALRRIALREDPAALALRGIAMAQLGEFARARSLLRRASRAFGPREALARARCLVAEAEVALASRDLRWAGHALAGVGATLESHGDRINAAHALQLEARRLLLLGRVEAAQQLLEGLDASKLPAAWRAAQELLIADIAVRRLQIKVARTALARAQRAAAAARVPALLAEVAQARSVLAMPAARVLARGKEQVMLLEDVEALFASRAVVIDACRYAVRDRRGVVALAKRPVLFTLARALGEAWPEDVPRDELIARAFRLRLADESQRVRLRVEMARLRKLLRPLAQVHATRRGFRLEPITAREVVILVRPVDEKYAGVLAFLADGESWSSSALALAMGASQRTVQRALEALCAAGKAHSMGHGRARRWLAAPLPGFTTALLLPTAFAIG